MSESLTLRAPAAGLTPGRRLLAVTALAAALAAVSPPGRLAVSMGLLLLAPGYLAERALPGPRPPLLVRMALWVGLSLSIVALIYHWCWAIGLAISLPLLWGTTAALAAAALAAAWLDLGRSPIFSAGPAQAAEVVSISLTLAILILTLWNRFVHIEGLVLPLWVDSVHHTLMVRVAAETGMAPVSLEPYLPVRAMPYHWGYHVFVGAVVRLSGLGPAEAVLLTGQIFNGMQALTAAGLARALWGRPAAAPVAAMTVGLLSLMPAYYLSWGRYTQLTGLLILPGLAIAWQLWLSRGGWGRWTLAVIALAGLSLVHIRVLIFGAALLASLSLVWAAGRPWPALRTHTLPALAAGVAAAVLTAPWLTLLVARALLPSVSGGGLAADSSYTAFDTGLLWVGHARWLAALALAGAWVCLWRRAAAAATILLWVALLILAANPWLITYLLVTAGVTLLGVGLLRRQPPLAIVGIALAVPGFGGVALPSLWLLNNESVVISLFLPIALLIAGGSALLADRAAAALASRHRPIFGAAATAVVTALSVWGALDMRGVVNEVTVLAGPADLAAITWVAEETPPDARFLINAAGWLPIARRGVDGGWWLLPLTGRWTSTPPVVIAYGSLDELLHVNAVGDTVIGYTPGGEQAIFDLIAAERITHIYLVEGKGTLQPAIFAGRPGFTQVYSRDGVVIFAVE